MRSVCRVPTSAYDPAECILTPRAGRAHCTRVAAFCLPARARAAAFPYTCTRIARPPCTRPFATASI